MNFSSFFEQSFLELNKMNLNMSSKLYIFEKILDFFLMMGLFLSVKPSHRKEYAKDFAQVSYFIQIRSLEPIGRWLSPKVSSKTAFVKTCLRQNLLSSKTFLLKFFLHKFFCQYNCQAKIFFSEKVLFCDKIQKLIEKSSWWKKC